MYSTDNYNSEQNYIYCRNNCGVRITFSDDHVSKNGRKIPLQENGLRHDCPNSTYNKNRRRLVAPRWERYAGAKSNRLEDYLLIDEAQKYIFGLKKRLTYHTINLVIEELSDRKVSLGAHSL
jgi:hypothetical protein